MTFGEQVWLAVIAAVLGLIGGGVGGAISGDIVAKRAFRRDQEAKKAAQLANWVLESLGTAACVLHNTGDEAGLDVRLEWHEGGSGHLEEKPIERIDPGDSRRVTAAPLSQERRVNVIWRRPDGTAHRVEREIPRSRR